MVSVVSLEDGLTQDEEVVLMLHQHQDARASIVLDIPHVVLWVNLEPMLVNHEKQRCHLPNFVAVNERDSLLCVESLVTRCLFKLFEDLVVEVGRDGQVGGARVEDRVVARAVGVVEGVSLLSRAKCNSLEVGRPVEIIIKPKTHFFWSVSTILITTHS